MLSRYVRRLCLSKREISKCGAHRCSTISDATLVEAVGKRSKIQVRRASLHDLFCISNGSSTRKFKGTFKGLRRRIYNDILRPLLTSF